MGEAFPDVKDYRTWPLYQQLLPHVQACVAWIDKWQFTFSEAGRLCNEVGLYLKDHAQYAEAETFQRRAITIGEKAFGPEHPDLAILLNNLANLCTDQEKYEEAEPLYQRAIAIDAQGLGLESPGLATYLNNLASLLGDQGRYKETEPLYQRAIAIFEKVLGSTHPNTITVRNNYEIFLRQWKKAKGE